MFGIWRRLRGWWRPVPPPRQGSRRVKHYSAQTGFHYQYELENAAPGDYRFLVRTTGQPARRIEIRVPLPELQPRDRYALAKLHLFRTFDEFRPAELPVSLAVTDSAALDEL